MWTTSFYLGNFIGPTVGGVLVQELGFRTTTTVFCCVYVIMAMGACCDFFYKTRLEKEQGRENETGQYTRLSDEERNEAEANG